MNSVIEIASLSDPNLAVYARLTEAQLRSRQSPEQGLFIAESLKVISCALDAGCEPVSFLMERGKLEGASALVARCSQAPVYTAERDVLCRLTGYELTRGVLCAMRRPPARTVDQVCAGARRLAVLEGLSDPTNVGAVFRSAAALGVDGVLLTPSCCDPLVRRAVRVSMGTIFQVPWARIGQKAEDWPRETERLRALGFRTAALALSERSLRLDERCLAAEEKLALVLGAEGDGLAPETIARCDYTVRIPMAHGVDSLNVAAASAVTFWQLCAPGRPR